MKTTRFLNILVGAALSVSLSSSVFAQASAVKAAGISAAAAAAAIAINNVNPAAVQGFRAYAIQNPGLTANQVVTYAQNNGIAGITVAGVESNIINLDAAKATALQGVTVVNTESTSALLASVKGADAAKCGLMASAPVSNRETLKAGNAAMASIANYVHTIQFYGDKVAAEKAASSLSGLVYSDVAVAEGAALVSKELAGLALSLGKAPSVELLTTAATNAAQSRGMPADEAAKLGTEIGTHCPAAFLGQAS